MTHPSIRALRVTVLAAMMALAALILAPTAGATTPATSCLANPLGAATGYTEFMQTNGSRGAESEGAIAYGGNLAASGMTVGTHLTDPPYGKTYPTLVVNGTSNSFNLQKGSAWTPGLTGYINFNGGGSQLASAPIDFSTAFSELTALSSNLATRTATGSAQVIDTSGSNPAGISLGGNALYLKGTDSTVNVFSVTPAMLAGNVAVLIEVPVGATALINVSGTNVQIDGNMFFRQGIGGSWTQAQDSATATQNRKTLWNFADATSVKLNTGSAFGGTILAPKAHVNAFNVGHNIGQVIAKSFESNRETHHAPFDGCLPGDTPPPPGKPKLVIRKDAHNLATTPPTTGDPVEVEAGGKVGFGLSVWNGGDGPSPDTVVRDNVPSGLTITYADPGCTITGQLVECEAGTLAPGESAWFWIEVTATLPAATVPSQNEQLTIYKVEKQISMQPGSTVNESIACNPGDLISDAAVRIDHIDQGTGDANDIQVHRLESDSTGSYAAKVSNHATGQAQLKLFAVCLPGKTSEGRSLTVGSPVTETVTLNPGTHEITLDCPVGSTPIAPGVEVSGGRALILANAPVGDTGRKLTLKVSGGSTVIEASIRCLDNRTTEVNGASSELVFTKVTKPIQVGAGEKATESLICGENGKGIVGGWEFDDGLVPLGNDPQPKSRVFYVWNPTSHPLTGTLYLLCLEARTGSSTPVDEKTYVNTATVSSSTEQKPGAVLSDDASVKVTRATTGPSPDSSKAPSIYRANLKGGKLVIGFRSATRSGNVKVSLPGKSKVIGKGSFRLGKAGNGKAKVKLSRKTVRSIRKGKIRKVKVKVTSSGGKTKTKTLRIRH